MVASVLDSRRLSPSPPSPASSKRSPDRPPCLSRFRRNGTGSGAAASPRRQPPASFSHLVTKLVLAAPASFFPAACVSQHFFTKLVLAAPASFLSPACTAQVASWAKAPSARRHNAARMVRVLMSTSQHCCFFPCFVCDRRR